MTVTPHTRLSLLLRLRDAADHDAWQQFVELYAPLVYRFARQRGLQDADAADLTQNVLLAVARSWQQVPYDPARGKFRTWLFTVARNKLNTFLTQSRRLSERVQPLADNDVPQPEEMAQWEQEYQQQLFHWAAEQVKGQFQSSTWLAFWATSVENRSPAAVAEQLGISTGAVYIARSRVLARLREAVQQIEEE